MPTNPSSRATPFGHLPKGQEGKRTTVPPSPEEAQFVTSTLSKAIMRDSQFQTRSCLEKSQMLSSAASSLSSGRPAPSPGTASSTKLTRSDRCTFPWDDLELLQNRLDLETILSLREKYYDATSILTTVAKFKQGAERQNARMWLGPELPMRCGNSFPKAASLRNTKRKFVSLQSYRALWAHPVVRSSESRKVLLARRLARKAIAIVDRSNSILLDKKRKPQKV